MDFIKVFSDIPSSQVVASLKVKNVKLHSLSQSMSVEFVSSYEISKEDKEKIEESILLAYPVKKLDAKYIVKTEKKTINPIIRGKDLKKAEPDKIKNIDQYYGKAVIEGSVIEVSDFETKRGNIVFKFDITDMTSSITCKCMLSKGEFERLSEHIKKDVYLRVGGTARFDEYDKELGIFAESINLAEPPKFIDDAPEKRVELHLHSKMSAMDSVIDIDKAIKRAAQWGHKAIAITDHGVVQAYPDAMDAGKENNIKIIYGMECYLVDDKLTIASKIEDYPLDGDFIAFDVKATTTSPFTGSILEIAAVRISSGQLVASFEELVNPGFNLNYVVTQKTGITTDMISDKENAEHVVKRFLDFAGDLPVIAEDVAIKVNFINKICEKIGCSFSNNTIEISNLAKLHVTSIKRYKLSTVAKKLGISYHSDSISDDSSDSDESASSAVGNSNAKSSIENASVYGEIFVKISEVLIRDNVKLLSGLESYYNTADYSKMKRYHAIILVKNQVGMKNLYKIISESHMNYFYSRPQVPRRILEENREGLILGSACEAGELFQSVVAGYDDKKLKEIAGFYDYLEIQPIGNNEFMIENGTAENHEQLQDFNKKIVQLAKDMDKLYVATCDAHFLNKEDSILRAIIQAPQYRNADRQPPLYFRNTTEMLDEFKYLDEETRLNAVVKNTNLIADMTEDDVTPLKKKQYAPRIDGAEEDVKRISYETAKEIYGDNLPEYVTERMNKELNSIINNGFSVMYVIAQKLVWKSLEDGYLVGSRGSVGSSFIAFLMKITEVNSLVPHYVCPDCKHHEFIFDGSYACGMDMPDKDCPVCGTKMKKDGYDIPFETFLGFHGEKDPDIDLNFSGEYQSQAHRYTEEIFGKEHVFKAGTISTLATKTAYGYVLKYLQERNLVASNAEKTRLALACEGVKKTTGQHPGGMVVVPDDMDIYEFCPIQKPADKTESDNTTTHFDYSKMKGTLLKFDILGHDDPTVLKMLGDLTGVDVQKIPLDDQKVMSLFTSTEALNYKEEYLQGETYLDPVGTSAVPEFGTSFVKQMLIDTKPTTFGELIRISGLSHGTNVWLGNAQELVRNGIAPLKEVICTRDDIMVNLMQMGLDSKNAFDIMEFTRKGKLSKHPELIPVMEEAKIPQWYIDSCLKISYMFPKAHAAAYVTMAFRIAWFKVYHPEAFYQAYYTIRADVFDSTVMTKGIEKVRELIGGYKHSEEKLSVKDQATLTILDVCNEMYSRGYKFAKIDLYKSDAVKFTLCEDGIRPPLSSMAGLGDQAAKAIAIAREEGEFTSVEDLRIRSGINKTAIEVLRQEGCLDGINETAQMTFF